MAGIIDWAAESLRYVLDSVLGPIKAGLDVVSAAWDEWIGRHIDEVLGPNYDPYHQTAEGYWLDGVFYPWGPSTGGRRSTLDVRAATDEQLVAAITTLRARQRRARSSAMGAGVSTTDYLAFAALVLIGGVVVALVALILTGPDS